jgi:hypothetical protein
MEANKLVSNFAAPEFDLNSLFLLNAVILILSLMSVFVSRITKVGN